MGVRRERRFRAASFFLLALVAPPSGAERLPLRLYDSAHGLAGDAVWVVRQDSHGLLWFGTDGGVSRFDGIAFRSYGRAEGVPEGAVADVLEMRSGELLFATQGGVCRLLVAGEAMAAVASATSSEVERARRFACDAPAAPATASDVRALHEDRLGRLWAATAAGLYRGERREGRWELTPAPLGEAGDPWAEVGVREIVEEPAGGLWIATALGLAHRTADGAVTHLRVSGEPVDSRIFSLLLDSAGRLWIGHVNDGVFVWRPPDGFRPAPGWSVAAAALATAQRRGSASPTLPGGPLRLPEAPGEAIRLRSSDGLDDERVRNGLVEDRDGAVWIGTVRGLGRFAEGRLERFDRANGLPDEGVRPSLVDRAGNLWFGSPSGGAVRLRRSGFTTYDESDGLHGARIRSVFEGRDGALYVIASAERDYLHRFDGHRFEAVAPRLPPGLLSTGWWIGQVGFEDGEGDWWMPTGVDGLLRFARPRHFADLARASYRAHYRPPRDLGTVAVQVIHEDRRGDVWIGAFGPPHVTLWRRSSGRFENVAATSGAALAAPTVFRDDGAGRVWIGLDDGTVARQREPGATSVERLERTPLPGGSAVYDLLFDARGRLWVATFGGGVARLDAPEIEASPMRVYTTASGLSSNDVLCLAEDRLGRIYVGSGKGIDRLDPDSGAVRQFTTADGLANNSARAAFRDRRGDLWFGTMQGLSRLRTEPEAPPRPPAALLTAVEVAGSPLPVGESGSSRVGPLLLAASADRLRFGFVAPSADLEVEPAYRYRLEGLESEWSPATRDRAVTYAGLRPGSYRFAVRAVLSGGEAGEPATFEFTLPAPLWRRWWALLAFASLPVAGAFLLHRSRLSRLLAVERVRSRIAADLHDDLGASLSRIAVLSEVANRKADGSGGEASELAEIAETARRITDEASDMVWSIDPFQDDLASLLARLRRLASDLLGERGVALEWSAPAEAGSVRLAADQRRHLLLILKEALFNAARHAGARRVEVRVEVSRHELSAEVRDDGRGFDASRPRALPGEGGGGRGLPNLEARARELGGRLTVVSAPGAGTSVTLRIPR